MRGVLAQIPDVSRISVIENDEDVPDANGIPPHTIAVVIAGGDALQIAQTIALKKTPGTGTAGTVSEIVIDPNGVPNTIRFYPLTEVALTLHVTISALTGYVSTTGEALKAAIADYINSLADGETSYLNRLYSPAELKGENAINATGKTQAQLSVLGKTYNVAAILQARDDNPPAAANIAFAFNEAPTCDVDDITLTIA
jgi:hypothetical protein